MQGDQSALEVVKLACCKVISRGIFSLHEQVELVVFQVVANLVVGDEFADYVDV